MTKNNIIALVAIILVLVALVVGGLVVYRPMQQVAGTADPQTGTPGEQTAVPTGNTTEAVAGFYKGKIIKWIVPYSPGGGYDEYARLISPYLSKYTGARVDILNMPGSGGMRGVNELFSSPNDGLMLGMMNGSPLVMSQLAGIEGAEYKLDEFAYIGRIVADVRVFAISKASNLKSFDDIWNAQSPQRVGATGLGGSTYVDAVISKEAFNLDFEIIHGFDSSSILRQSMLRGDVVGTWGSWGSAEDGVDSGFETIVLQSGRERLADLSDVPTVFEYADKTQDPERTRAILTAWEALIAVGRSVAAPPGTPADRLEFLRTAFKRSLEDPELLAAAKQSGRIFMYASGDEMLQITKNATMMPEDIKQLFIKAIRGEQ